MPGSCPFAEIFGISVANSPLLPLRFFIECCSAVESDAPPSTWLQYQARERTLTGEYHKGCRPSLGRDMELLVFGHTGVPAVVFPTSQGRFYEFEDRGMVHAIVHKIENGELQLYCLDSVDSESWYNRNVPPRWRIARHVQYESYVMDEVLPLVRQKNWNPHLARLGGSSGGDH